MLKRFTFFTFLFIISCADNISKHGIEIKANDLAKLNVGSTSQVVIEELIGLPTLKTKRGEQDIWLYFDYARNKKALEKSYYQKYTAYELIFEARKLAEIRQYNLTDMNILRMEPKITKSVTKQEGFFKQLLRNVGRFDSNDDL